MQLRQVLESSLMNWAIEKSMLQNKFNLKNSKKSKKSKKVKKVQRNKKFIPYGIMKKTIII